MSTNIATGQITIIDYNDALTLTGFISSNVVKTQTYNPDNGKFTPDWSITPFCVLTPSLYKLGTTSDIITDAAVTSVNWYEIIGGVETLITATSTRVFSGSKNQVLTLKTNELSNITAKDYICIITYLDPSTSLSLQTKISISFAKINNGSGVTTAVAVCPNGNVFKNTLIGTLTADCDLLRGSIKDTTNVTYQWYMQDSSVIYPCGNGIVYSIAIIASASIKKCSSSSIIKGSPQSLTL